MLDPATGLWEGIYGLGGQPWSDDARDWSALLHPGIAQRLHAGAPQIPLEH